jgi:hypothetical protein
MRAVYNVCKSVRNSSTEKISFHNLLAKIRKEFQKNQIDLYIRSNKRSSLHSTEFYVNAYYDAEDDLDNEIPIEIVIYHNFDKTILWNRAQITELLIQIFDAVIHEFKHQHQSEKRSYQSYWPHSSIVLQYLSDPDEVDAYALSIAIELCRTLGKERSIRYLSRFKVLSKYKIQHKLVSPNLFAFVNVFEEKDSKILKILVKKVFKLLHTIDTDLIFM